MTVGETIKTHRLNTGLTQRQLAEQIGVKHNTVSDWENDKTSPDTDQLTRLCEALKISADLLLGTNFAPDTLTPDEQRIGRAYGRADPPVKETVEVALKPYMEEPAPKVVPAPVPDEPEEEEPRLIQLFDLPVSAGRGVYLHSDAYDMVEAGPDVPPSADFGIRILGDSMEPRYHNGQIAWIKKTDAIDVGQIGVFIINNEGFIKRKGRKKLESLNPKFPDVKPGRNDDMRTVGRVIGVSEAETLPIDFVAYSGGHTVIEVPVKALKELNEETRFKLKHGITPAAMEELKKAVEKQDREKAERERQKKEAQEKGNS